MRQIKREYFITAEQLEKLNRTGYSEVNFIDFYNNGLQAKGTEDFSQARWEATTGDASQISWSYYCDSFGRDCYAGVDEDGECYEWVDEFDTPKFAKPADPVRHAKLDMGEIVRNAGGGEFIALERTMDDRTKMRNTKSGWTFFANTLTRYADGSVEWDYSTAGSFC